MIYPSMSEEQLDLELARLYPGIGNGHADSCLCPACAPHEYEVFKCPHCHMYEPCGCPIMEARNGACE
jgi:hypothetical protein